VAQDDVQDEELRSTQTKTNSFSQGQSGPIARTLLLSALPMWVDACQRKEDPACRECPIEPVKVCYLLKNRNRS
jgi:hypothetical protein